MQPWETVPEDVFEERADDPGVALCPNCLNPTRYNANFCHTCICPLTWYAGTGPLERVFAWPWIMAKAGTTPWPRRIHPWGVTLYMGLGVVGGFLLIVATAFFGSDGNVFPLPEVRQCGPVFVVLTWAIMIVLGVLNFILYTLYTVRAWVNWIDRRDVDPWADEA